MIGTYFLCQFISMGRQFFHKCGNSFRNLRFKNEMGTGKEKEHVQNEKNNKSESGQK